MSDFLPLIRDAAERHGLPADLLYGVIKTESNFDPKATSPSGARGLMQLMPIALQDIGKSDINVEDPAQNIDAGAMYLKKLVDRFGNTDDAVRAYNMGPTGYQKYLDDRHRVAAGHTATMALPAETAAYLPKVTAASADYASDGEDLGKQYAATPVESIKDRITRLKALRDQAEADHTDKLAEATAAVEVKQAEAKSATIGDHVAEIPGAIDSGIIHGAGETLQFGAEVTKALGADWVAYQLNRAGEATNAFGDQFRPEHLTGQLVEGVSQFVAGFAGTGKIKTAIKAETKAAEWAVAAYRGAIADTVVFDPHQERLSNLVQTQPALANPVNAYLAADPADSDAEGRFKNAVEGLGLGIVADTFIKGVKFIKDKAFAGKTVGAEVTSEPIPIERPKEEPKAPATAEPTPAPEMNAGKDAVSPAAPVERPAAPPANGNVKAPEAAPPKAPEAAPAVPNEPVKAPAAEPAPVAPADRIREQLTTRLKQIGISPDIGGVVVDVIRHGKNGAGYAGGTFNGMRKLITIAVNGPQGVRSATQHTHTINHEVVHALRHLNLFTPQEWDVLAKAAHATPDIIESVNARYKHLPLGGRTEEAIADLFGRYVTGQIGKEATATLPTKLLNKFRDLLVSLKKSFNFVGYNKSEDIFAAIDRGEFGARLQANKIVHKTDQEAYAAAYKQRQAAKETATAPPSPKLVTESKNGIHYAGSDTHGYKLRPAGGFGFAFDIYDRAGNLVKKDAGHKRSKQQADLAGSAYAARMSEAHAANAEKAAVKVEDIPTETPVVASAKAALRFTPEEAAALAKAVREGNLTEARGLIDFNEHTFDWNALGEDANGIRNLLNTVSNTIGGVIDTAKGGVQSHKETVRLAHLVGLSADQVDKLFGDIRGGVGMTARLLAAHNTMLASGRQVLKLLDAAEQAVPGSPADLAFQKQVAIHAAIEAQVKGATTEAGRMLNAMRILKKAEAEGFSLKDTNTDATAFGGDRATYFKQFRKAAAGNNLVGLNRVVRKMAGRRWSSLIVEFAQNNLLWGLKTHIFNAVTNAYQVSLGVADRYVAAAIGKGVKLFKSDAEVVAFRQANAFAYGAIQGLKVAHRYAFQALKTGLPVTDVRQAAEFAARGSYKLKDGVQLQDRTGQSLPARASGALKDFINATPAQQTRSAINAVGEVAFNGMFRFLVAGDEYFKSVSYMASLHEAAMHNALQIADSKGLKGAAREKHIGETVAKLLKDPTDQMKAGAIDTARYNTFQEEPGQFSKGAEKMLNANPIIKVVVAPFLRTPMNILRQSMFDRTPLGLASQRIWGELAAGGERAQIAAARITIGTSILVQGYEWASQDKPLIVGGAKEWNNTGSLDKVPPYSILMPNGEYMQFDRLGPLGTFLGLAADFTEAMHRYYNSEDPETVNSLAVLAGSTVTALYQNALSKTFMTSLNDLADLLGPNQKDTTLQDKFDKFAATNLQKFIPGVSAVRAYTYANDPVVRAAYNLTERLNNGLPGQLDLSPRFDYLGRPITRSNAQVSWLNPFATTPDSKDPLDRELARLAYDFSLPQRDIGGVKLTTVQHQDLIRRTGQTPIFNGLTLEQKLRQVVESSDYKKMSDTNFEGKGGKQYLLQKYYNVAAEHAKKSFLLDNPDVFTKVKAARVAAQQHLVDKKVDVLGQ